MKGFLSWNGDYKNLPPRLENFDFKGTTYYWDQCPCEEPGCNRPVAYTTDGKRDNYVTSLLRGLDQGTYTSNMLVKFYGVLPYADKSLVSNDFELFMEAMNEIMTEEGPDLTLLQQKGIAVMELILALQEIKEDIQKSVSTFLGVLNSSANRNSYNFRN